MSSRTVSQIIERVKVICVDLDANLDDEVPTAIERAQEDAEDFWDRWPFLNEEFDFLTVVDGGQYLMSAYTTLFPALKRFLRWRFEAKPVYISLVADGGPAVIEMDWAVGRGTSFIANDDMPFENIHDLRRHSTHVDKTPEVRGAPAVLAPIDRDNLQQVATDTSPQGFWISPPHEKVGWKIIIPFQARQIPPTGTNINYWTLNMARYLENAAAATMLADNQDARFAAYASMADADLSRHQREVKRRGIRTENMLTPRSDVFARRDAGRLAP